ncbi:type 4a pilus biogenesis protein PilO [Teredinibacter sp. KSP-S5-2]|uniref:type 4a pilus biogenesis protein PilO n=1 Tax=Teredinibacter sp. KSP-S5-2 TaxID=3034506 RepID=UPI002934231A|nr:type 4a pilus biogenesis protein PilO [Teredinibacter sp. KSP-S5-2]WNO08194.1 type 4a pilus biogenesis protein PilO [Teredinibacter sp. KSP-S5-2]
MDLNQYIEQLQNFDVNNIEWERVGVWPLPARIFLFVLTVAALLVGTYFLTIKDKKMQLQGVQTQEQTLRRSFETKAFEAANLDRYRQQMVEMEESFGALVSRLPSDTEVPGLLEDIDDKGVESRLVIESIDLQPEVSTEFHIELPIKIKVTGGYHEFATFISGVAGMPRIVTLHNFEIKSSKSSGNQEMDVLAKTYRYKNQE